MRVTNALVGTGLISFALLTAAPLAAETMNFAATLDNAQEVPPTKATATGNVAMTFDGETKLLTWKGSYSGLTGAATAAHFHGPAPAGKNAPVVVPIAEFGSSFEGKATLTAPQSSELLAGELYVNVHTAANPNGEIRGQVIKVK